MITYEFTSNQPKAMEDKQYIYEATTELDLLLKNFANDETKFQSFFEKNPCFMPGARDEFSSIGQSGHRPHLNCLITQPKITGLINRIPDFMWLASDSAFFIPIIIEIEAPEKKLFNKDGKPTSHYFRARHQLEEWQSILTRPENITSFYRDFSIPQDLRELTFKPRFVLIYGRREEYKDSLILKQKRGSLVNIDQFLMSYDRIHPIIIGNYITCEVKNGQYKAKYLSPTFKIGPSKDELLEVGDLLKAVKNSDYMTENRKKFLLNKIPYCLEYCKAKRKGITVDINYYPPTIQTEE